MIPNRGSARLVGIVVVGLAGSVVAEQWAENGFALSKGAKESGLEVWQR